MPAGVVTIGADSHPAATDEPTSPLARPAPHREGPTVAVAFLLTRLLVRTGLARLLPRARRWADGGGDFLHYYSDRVLSAPLDGLALAADYLGVGGPDAIDLAAAAPRVDLVPSASTRLPADRRGYPTPGGLLELRNLLAEQRYAESRHALSPIDEVLVTAGASGAWATTLDTFVNPGDRVVLFDPCSPLLALAAQGRRARLRWVPTWLERGRIRFHLEPFARAMRGAKLLALADPSSPAGGVFAPEDLEQVAWWANRLDVLIYADESFGRFRYEGERAWVGGFPGAERRTLTAGGVSKGHGLASARVGWLTGHRHLLRPCAVTAGLSTPFVPTLAQQQAAAALRQGDEAFLAVRDEFASRRQYVFERLRGLALEPAWPAGGFFFWVPVAGLGLTGRAFAERLLRSHRVLVTPGECYGPSGRCHVRLSYAADEGRLREGLSRLAAFVAELRTNSEPVPELERMPTPRATAAAA